MATSQASIRIGFNSILFATDFSPASEAAFPYALSLAHCYDSKVIVAHAVPIELVTGMTAVPPPADLELDLQEAKQGMQKYADTDFEGLRHELLVEKGYPPAILTDLIKQEHVDLVVLGTHGRKGLSKLFMGSVAEQIFRKATCPVLTVGPATELKPQQIWKPARIILATDFSKGSFHALPYAIALAEENHAELILLHAAPLVPWEQQTEMAHYYQKRLEEMIPSDHEPSCKIDFAVRFDLAAPAILAMASDKHADLIVMGVHHTPFPTIDSHVPWTTACEVISDAHCPVLTVRA
ncbi:MAG: universal stress protein [Acidobacteriia bacterium]|nr:universal stress protein [Terriglobia bacterium]